MLSIIVPLILLDLGLLSLYNKRLIDDIPTSKTMGAFVGHVELKGTAESENPLTSFISGTKCVLYSWSVMEKNDSTYWITLSEGGQSSTFYLKDDTGAIRIDPKNALLYTSTILNFSDDQNTNLSYDKRTSSDMNHSQGIRPVSYTHLRAHET